MEEPIAIIGSACRFPGGANSPTKLWGLLEAPRDVLSEFSKDRMNLTRFYNKNGEHHGSTDVQNHSYILAEDHRLFDASFFKISPLEAEGMDPQQRYLLETVYEALESAGCTLEAIQGTLTSVYVGAMTADFADIQFRDTEVLASYSATGTQRSILSNRISYFFDLRGPSMTVDTACSSSLVGLHLAVQGLRNGDAKCAIVAGSSLLLDPSMYIAESKLHMLSPDSRSRMWDKNANGYARGEGFAAMLLKPLGQALKDGDHIECLIRGTGVNSDGRTKGITMPSSEAQTELIRQTYLNAGLDPVNDRPQYFECHGTGTAAGDPREAQAVKEAFYPSHDPATPRRTDQLYVGSIKTVIGHLEGAAGLAGVLKASLAIQNGTIPPNMHFNELSSSVAPYYQNLEIPITSMPWPDTAAHSKRASINSFGFGGTNAHAILESFEQQPHGLPTDHGRDDTSAGPFLFSANSETSLAVALKDMLAFLERTPGINLSDLAWMLQSRRTVFPVKTSVSARTYDKLIESLHKLVSLAPSASGNQVGTRVQLINSSEPAGILGVFTGQGAQWATMGKSLYESCPLFRTSIDQCADSLASLPDPPPWSLSRELLAEPSRLSEAALSQPLCTALQIALVDLLTAAGIKFDAVVGHSSGEIAATYAAGIISAHDAIRIAYYRGVHAKAAKSPTGQQGAMMAVSLTFEEAKSFCVSPPFFGRVVVAASNSPSSVTLSGDKDAILEAKAMFDDKKTFARVLAVDTAYHSHHMLPCAEIYLQSLIECNIQVRQPKEGCVWISSVRGDVALLDDRLDVLRGQYWVDNMVNPVLFSHAIDCSLWNGGPFDIAIEVGPHPALKGPASQTIKNALGSSPPYFAFLERGRDALETFSEAAGNVWTYLGPLLVDFEGFRQSFEPLRRPRMLKGLPSYAWDHDKIYWKESRISRNYRLRHGESHPLLGKRVPDDSDFEMRWRNVLRQNELPWTRGHRFQGQVIFPGAGYISICLEAAKTVAPDRPIKFIEFLDVLIPRGLVIEDGSAGVETVFTLKVLNPEALLKHDSQLKAEFACYMCADERIGTLEKGCEGTIVVHFGQPSLDDIPPRPSGRSNLAPVDVERFYEALGKIGLDYSGVFKKMTSMNRVLGRARGIASWSQSELAEEYTLHPSVLDLGFQAGFAAYASPATDVLRSAYLPTSIRRLIVNPNINCLAATGDTSVAIDAFVTKASSLLMEVDISVSDPETGYTMVQVEGLGLKGISEQKPSEDRLLFAENFWKADVSHGFESVALDVESPLDIELFNARQRTALWYFRTMLQEIRPEELPGMALHHRRLHEAVTLLLAPVYEGKHRSMPAEWLNDDLDTITKLSEKFPGAIDLDAVHVAGRNLIPVLRGEADILEALMEDNLLERIYTEDRGFAKMSKYLAQILNQIVYKYPHLKLLEIGAGTGGTTQQIFDLVGGKFASYEYTDISAGFFDQASKRFDVHSSKLTFKMLDIEKELSEQGFSEGVYDVVIAANVLHATRNMNETMQHARSLLRPGGYLLLVEITGNALQIPLVMGQFAGWWLGVEEGRTLTPGLSLVQWNELLQGTGFSGVDYNVSDMTDPQQQSYTLIVSQATDEKFELLRDPLSGLDVIPEEDHLLIIGGQTLPIARLVRNLQKKLGHLQSRTTLATSIDNVDTSLLPPNTSIICLTELDKPLFLEPMTESRLTALQSLFAASRDVLWITSGCQSLSPHSNMMLGIGRALSYELPELNLQFLDFDSTTADSTIVAETFLRNTFWSTPDFSGYNALWTTEPELVYNGERILIPRVFMANARNGRLNASKRLITSTVPEIRDVVSVKESNCSLQLVETKPLMINATTASNVMVDVMYSTALPLRTHQTYYLCLGKTSCSGHVVLALTTEHCSRISIASESLFEISEDRECTPELLHGFANHLVACLVLSKLPPNGSMMVYDCSSGVVDAIMDSAQADHRRIIFATSRRSELRDDWLCFHPQASQRAIRTLLPKDLTTFVDMSYGLASNIQASLPSYCSLEKPDFSNSHTDLSSWFLSTMTNVSTQLSEISQPSLFETYPIRDLAGASPLTTVFPNVIDWTNLTDLTIQIEPLDASNMFSPAKTYIMVGATGELGQSLCRWMVDNGAIHFVLTSRTAAVDEDWVAEMHALGANIKILRMDVTERNSVRSVVKIIRDTMPPIGGIANLAMVLLDKLFMDTDFETVNKQLQPKMLGGINLDEEFYEEALDFFILFGSMATTIGNAGQSIYHAANLFAVSLADQRKARGFAASVVSPGMITDIGYIARTGRHIEDHLRKNTYQPLSEVDIHQQFAEAIVAGHPAFTASSNIMLGISEFVDSASAPVRPPWFSNPRFCHLILEDDAVEEESSTGSSAAQARQKLETAQSESVAAQAVQELFSFKLEVLMQVSAETLNPNSTLLDYGCDSLLAVEIRNWFRKALDVDVPLLKILSQDSISMICIEVARKFMQSQVKKATTVKAAEVVLASIASESAPGADNIADDKVAQSPESLEYKSSSNSTSNDGRASTSGTSTPSTSATEPGASDVSHNGSAKLDDVRTALEEDTPDLQPMIDFDRVEKMSFAQQRMWFLREFLKSPTTYNITVSYTIRGRLNPERFKRALQTVISRHHTFRTCFFAEPSTGELLQGIMSKTPQYFDHIASADEDAMKKIFDDFASHTWDLKRGDIFRATLLSFAPDRHAVVFGYHHIIMDGVSWHFFLRDLNHAYQLRPTKQSPHQYADFAVEQIEAAASGDFDEDLSFWHRLHALPLEPLPLLPFSRVRTRKTMLNYDSHTIEKEITVDLVDKIKATSQKLGITPFHFHLTVVQVLVARLLQIEEIGIGVTDANRSDERFAQGIGFFLNILPLRFRVDKSEDFTTLAKRTSQSTMAGYAHSKVPFDLILERLNVPRSSAYSPLFQTAVNYRVGEMIDLSLGECKLELDNIVDAENPYDFAFTITQIPSRGTCGIQITSHNVLYTPQATQLIMDTYICLLQSISSDCSSPIHALPLHHQSSMDASLQNGRGPRVDHAWPRTIVERVDLMIKKNVHGVAIKDNTGSLTYSQLGVRVNSLASALLAQGLSAGSPIAVLCHPSADLVVSMLAILRIGGVYAPLDLSLPHSRHAAMLDCCKTGLILAHDQTLARALQLGTSGRTIFNIAETSVSADDVVVNMSNGDTPAFLLYTSGSTGTPKGISLPQAGVMNYAAAKSARLSLGKEVVLQQSSAGFDMSIAQIVNALCNGGTLVMVPQSARGDPLALSKLMLDEKVTFTIATPSEYLTLVSFGRENLQQYHSWRNACLGGEQVTDRLREEFARLGQPDLGLTDCYGPTEISCAATFGCVTTDSSHDDELDDFSSVGKPLPNTSVYILDESEKPVPTGMVGEICIGGAGVTLGYVDLPQLNKAKFRDDPFARPEDIAQGWTKLYKTGDKGRLLADGSLLFMGRLDGDTQVKLRGLRIELDEVANALIRAAEGSLIAAIVTVRGDPAFLVAHVVIAEGQILSDADLRELTKSLPLPQYMWPSMLVAVEHLPMTTNGKIDRSAVQKLLLKQHISNEELQPRSSATLTLSEGELRLLWQEVLDQTSSCIHIHSDSDFFMVGGSSLLLVNLQNAIKQKIGIILPISDLYEASTLSGMSAKINLQKEQNPGQVIDWEHEIRVPKNFGRISHPLPAVSRSQPQEILLTGATSFLGSSILKSLLSSESIRAIHCLAVPRETKKALPTSDKIVCYPGSLMDPTLGLTSNKYSELQSRIDMIIHIGSFGHCLNTYSTVRTPNYLATRFLAGFAVPRQIPLHFLSSNRVTLLSGSVKYPPMSLASHPTPSVDGSEGFTAAKWASERFLENLAAETNVPVRIHRSCAVIGDEAPSEDAQNALLRYSIMMRAVPKFENMEGYFDFKDVDVLAGEIVASCMEETSGSDAEDLRSASFIHHSSGVEVPVSKFRERMDCLYGGPFDELSQEEWLERAVQLGIEPLIVSYLRAIIDSGRTVSFPYMGVMAR